VYRPCRQWGRHCRRLDVCRLIYFHGGVDFVFGLRRLDLFNGLDGGYVLLALLLAPYLRKFGKYTVPDFVGDRYYSNVARVVAVIAAIFVSMTYVAGQMRGVGIVFSRFLQVDINTGVIIGMVIVAFLPSSAA
jgi:Na+(H+)/acetate symporter ActP